MSENEMPNVSDDLLTCIVCVRQVRLGSDKAEGWVLVQRSVDEGDASDDAQWKCPKHVTAADKLNYDFTMGQAFPEDPEQSER